MAARNNPQRNGSLTGAKPLRDALMLELMTDAPQEVDPKTKAKIGPRKETYARRIARKLVHAAAKGEIDAIKEIHNRVEGKAVQPLANDPENPLMPTDPEKPFTIRFISSKTKK